MAEDVETEMMLRNLPSDRWSEHSEETKEERTRVRHSRRQSWQ